ncbi:MAG: alpha/beta hydrolase [Actinomycetota bacterium]
MTTQEMNPTERELAAIAGINESGRQPVVLIHGLWLLAGSWARWEQLLEQQGYAPIAIDWPGEPESVSDARVDPQALAGPSIDEVTERAEGIIGRLARRPVVIGHSVGGLVAQKLAGRGVASAAVAIDPAPFKGLRGLPWSVVKSSFPVLKSPGNRSRAVTLTLDQFTYGFANAVPAAEAEALYQEFHVAAPGRPLFEVAFANFSSSSAAKVHTESPERGPLLIISGGADHTVPPSVAKAAHSKQAKNQSPTEFIEIENAGHSLVIDHRWQEVATTAIDFMQRSGVAPGRTADRHLS